MNGSAARRHLVLVGLMGAGKTTVGARCAERLGRPLVDTDEIVVATSGQSVPELFASEGEAGFRVRERAALVDACAAPEPLVIACGGGAVLDPENRATMRAAGLVVWLRASPRELAARVGDGSGRPLLTGAPTADALERLVAVRTPAYEAAAHAVVDTDGLDPETVAGRVLEEAQRCAA
ncbi:MAG TPA: shikimate kinase [Acidimicrobiia bacterium]|jgi:shikimate kinase